MARLVPPPLAEINASSQNADATPNMAERCRHFCQSPCTPCKSGDGGPKKSLSMVDSRLCFLFAR
eukprot:7225497-Pyramimonas_sp.AAC.1